MSASLTPRVPLREHPAARRLASKRILIAEDDVEIRAMLRRVLETVDAVVTEADSSAAALDAVGRGSVDVVVLDWHLAGEDADAVLSALTRTDGEKPLPTVVITGDPRVAAKLSPSRHASTVLLKPFSPGDLLGALATTLDGGC